jgi:hypothetical protein
LPFEAPFELFGAAPGRADVMSNLIGFLGFDTAHFPIEPVC